jgi:hypothetical protein
VSYVHVQQLASIEAEYRSTRTAIEHLERTWHEFQPTRDMRGIGLSQVRETARNLEATYIIRLFSEFEGILQEHWVTSRPGQRIPGTAKSLIDRVASSRRLPSRVRDDAHKVRDYRNSVVHPRLPPAIAVDFRGALAALNRFLDPLP